MPRQLDGRAVYVAGNDLDTDRIIPARFLKCVTFDELGPALFHDERFDEAGNSRGHVLDSPEHQGASILISDANFGCGSSREHAPQALQKFGIRAVIAESFAEIFFGNCTVLGIPCVSMAEGPRRSLTELLAKQPDLDLVIDLAALEVRAGNLAFPVDMKASARDALLAGTNDPLSALLANHDRVAAVAARLGYR